MSDIIERARALRSKMEELASANLTDEEAEEYPELLPQWSEGKTYKAGDRVRGADGILYKVLQNHSSQTDWKPGEAPSLFAKILADKDDSGKQTEVKEWEQSDSTNPYSKGDRVLHNGKTYESLVDNNVWEPGVIGTMLLWKEVTALSEAVDKAAGTITEKLKGGTDQ